VRLTPWEEERLLIFGAAELARRHRAAGLLLNAPEAIALICDAMLEAARAGASYANVEAAGHAAVGPSDVMDGVRELVADVRLEVLLEDGARLIVVVDPLGRGAAAGPDGPGAITPGGESGPEGTPSTTKAGGGRAQIELVVENTSSRVVRISSHFPFDRVNRRLVFDRAAAAGHRLDIDAGSSVRWSPGETKTVTLVRYGGESSAVGDPGEPAT
jgi:urease subunit gamma/beta